MSWTLLYIVSIVIPIWLLGFYLTNERIKSPQDTYKHKLFTFFFWWIIIPMIFILAIFMGTDALSKLRERIFGGQK